MYVRYQMAARGKEMPAQTTAMRMMYPKLAESSDESGSTLSFISLDRPAAKKKIV